MNFIQLKRNLKKRKRKINSCNFIKQLKKKTRLTYADLGVAILRRVCGIAHTVAAAILRGGVCTCPVPPLRPSTARDGAISPGSPRRPLTVNYRYQLCLCIK